MRDQKLSLEYITNKLDDMTLQEPRFDTERGIQESETLQSKSPQINIQSTQKLQKKR